MGTCLVLSACNRNLEAGPHLECSPFSLTSCPRVMAVWTTHLSDSPSLTALLSRFLTHWTSLPNKDLPLFGVGSASGGIPAKTATSG